MDIAERVIPLRRLLRRFGVDVIGARPNVVDLVRRQRAEIVLDVGANTGQYGQYLRSWGYRGEILSFEPLTGPFRMLQEHSAADPRWQALNVAIGNHDGEANINVSELSVFSSIRGTLPALESLDGRSSVVRQETVKIRRLDSLLPELVPVGRRAFLKVDTQGFEREVIDGAAGCLDSIVLVQLEASLRPLYRDEALLGELLQMMQERGFVLTSIHPVILDPQSGATLQVDCVFAR